MVVLLPSFLSFLLTGVDASAIATADDDDHHHESLQLYDSNSDRDLYHHHDHRELQQEWINDPNYVSEPVFHYSGYRFNMDYRISSSLDVEKVIPELWTDENCQRPIESGNPIIPYQLILDPADNVFGDEIAGTRIIRISSLVKPDRVPDARFASYRDGSNFAAINYCSTVNIKQDFTSRDIAFTRENHFNLDVDITGPGIQSYLQDEEIEDSWQVNIYRCDEDLLQIPDTELANLPPIRQGQRVRVCVTTTESARRAGIFIHNINEFTYQRVDDGLVQTAISTGQVPAEDGSTQVLCRNGLDLCAIDSALSNSFFHSPGRVEGIGEIRLQFGLRDADQPTRQRLLSFKDQLSPSLPHSTSRSGGSSGDDDNVAMVPATTEKSRRLYEVGNIVTMLNPTINIDIEPSTERYTAEAYRCDSANEPVDLSIPVVYGSGVRICVKPSDNAQDDDVYVRELKSFVFQREVGDSLVAIDDEGVDAEDGRTLVICSSGSSICALKTELPDWFFVTKGAATVTGSVVLQFGSQTNRRRVKANVVLRGLQSTTADEDPGFAGLSQVMSEFYVSYSTAARKNPRVWWSSSPGHLKFLYALAIGVACLIALCTICGGCFFCFKRKQAKEFIMNDIMDMNVKETDDSVDAFADSRASYYSDLDFDTDFSGNSSDEESISEKFEEDLEDKVAILFPQNGSLNDLTQPLGLSSSHGPSQTGPNRRAPPGRSKSQPLPGMTGSLHSTPGRGYPGRGYPQGRGGRGPGSAQYPRTNRSGDGLTMSEHRRPSNQPPGRNQQLSQSEHVPIGQRKPSIGPSGGGGGRGAQGRGKGGRATPQRYHSDQPMTRPPIRGNPRQRDRLSHSEHVRPQQAVQRKKPGSSKSLPKAKQSALNKNIEYENGQHKDGFTNIPVVGNSPKKGKASKAKTAKTKKSSSKKKLAQDSTKPKSKEKKSKSIDGKTGPGSKKQKKDKKDSTQQSASTSATSMDGASSDSDDGVRDKDICFEASGHPGFEDFLAAVKATVKKFGPSAYSPKIYRHIKRQLPGRRFYVCEDENNLDEWSDVTEQKGKMIDLFYNYHQEALSHAFGATIIEETEGALDDDLSPADG